MLSNMSLAPASPYWSLRYRKSLCIYVSPLLKTGNTTCDNYTTLSVYNQIVFVESQQVKYFPESSYIILQLYFR